MRTSCATYTAVCPTALISSEIETHAFLRQKCEGKSLIYRRPCCFCEVSKGMVSDLNEQTVLVSFTKVSLSSCARRSSSSSLGAGAVKMADRRPVDPADFEALPEEDKVRMSNMIEHLQVRDSLKMYNSLVERCFSNCVDSFRRKTLDKQEETCVQRCAEKYLKHSMRVSMRFAELNQGNATAD